MKIWVPVKVTILHLSDGNKIPLSDATAEQKKAFYNGQIEGEKDFVLRLVPYLILVRQIFQKKDIPKFILWAIALRSMRRLLRG